MTRAASCPLAQVLPLRCVVALPLNLTTRLVPSYLQRKSTLLVEYKQLRKANAFIDRRFGGAGVAGGSARWLAACCAVAAGLGRGPRPLSGRLEAMAGPQGDS